MLRPRDESELAEAIRAATGPLRIVGGGTRGIGRPVAGTLLETGAIAGITLYEPGALTLVARAGTPVAEIEAALAAEGQRLAFEVPDWRGVLGAAGGSTIGGVVAANASGPRRVQAGACRDALIGVRFVDGAGTVAKNGGRVMKNVTGYDLVKLMAGAWGTLGVLSEVSFKLQARAEAEATLLCRGLGAGAGIAALTAALGSPYDVSGAAHLGAGAGEEARTQIRIEGMTGSVAYRRDRLLTGALKGFEVVEGAASAALWREVRDVAPFAVAEGAIWRVSVKPSDGPGLSAALAGAGLAHRAIFDWGGGLVWLLVDAAGDAGAAAIRTRVAALGGHATLFRAPEQVRATVPVFQPEAPALAAISKGLRAKFDPRGILNPGLMG